MINAKRENSCDGWIFCSTNNFFSFNQYGKVVGTEFLVIQVRDDQGRISWFCTGHCTHFESRVPFFGDRVRIEYVKDKLGRNVVTRIEVLRWGFINLLL